MNRCGAKGRGLGRIFGERGSSAVEAALVTPLVMALLFGIIEMGFLFKDYLGVAAAVRAGVRIASANPRIPTFAQVAADQVARTGGAISFSSVQQLWVYKADPVTNFPTGFTDFSNCTVCVKFTWNGSSFVQNTGGPEQWLGSSQNACSAQSIGGPPDRIGVYLSLRHQSFTNLIFHSINIADASVLSLEPMPVLEVCK